MGLFGKKQETPAKRGAEDMAQPSADAAGPSGAVTAVSAPSQTGTTVDAAEAPSKDVLLQVPLAELHKVSQCHQDSLKSRRRICTRQSEDSQICKGAPPYALCAHP